MDILLKKIIVIFGLLIFLNCHNKLTNITNGTFLDINGDVTLNYECTSKGLKKFQCQGYKERIIEIQKGRLWKSLIVGEDSAFSNKYSKMDGKYYWEGVNAYNFSQVVGDTVIRLYSGKNSKLLIKGIRNISYREFEDCLEIELVYLYNNKHLRKEIWCPNIGMISIIENDIDDSIGIKLELTSIRKN